MSKRAIAAILLACAASDAFGAPLTEEEKKLLAGAMTESTARELGKAADAAGLERIVAIGDPQLVRVFMGSGLSVYPDNLMPPAIEALVVKYYNDPRVGAELRAVQSYYQSRALFDLHLDRVKTAARSTDPVFVNIFRTRQPGIEDALLANVDRFPTQQGYNPVIGFLAMRKDPRAIDPMIANLPQVLSRPVSDPLYALMDYDDPAVWRRTEAEVERLKGTIPPEVYDAARKRLDGALADPQRTLAIRRASRLSNEFGRRIGTLKPDYQAIDALRNDPPRYIEAFSAYLAQAEVIAAEVGGEFTKSRVANDQGQLGRYARLKGGDAQLAERALEKGAQGGDAMAQVGLGDFLQFVKHDKANAITVYERALETASNKSGLLMPYSPPGEPMNAFWTEWLKAEIAWLRTGKRFNGTVSEAAVRGFWEVQRGWWGTLARDLAQWHPPAGPPPSDWAAHAQRLESLAPATLAPRLAREGASRLTLLVTLGHVSALPEADAILREMERNDPSGFWTAIVMATVARFEATGRDAALANGLAYTLPGMAASGKPNALATAAQRFLRSSGLRVADGK